MQTQTQTQLDRFTRAYIECALWSTNDESDENGGRPMDENYGAGDIAPETLATIVADCQAFQAAHDVLITAENCPSCPGEFTVTELAGHDFWLTRNGHGAGFWDGDWQEPAATILTDAAHAFGEVDLYIGDDGLIHC
jgi:hypothetical protein